MTNSEIMNEQPTNDQSPAAQSIAEQTASPPAETGPVETETDRLRKELASVQAQAAEYLDGWQRARAEFANYKRRQEKEQAEAEQQTAGRIILRYLEVLDDFERAMEGRPTNGEAATWAEGISLIYRKFQNLLEAEGVTRISAAGQLFDPAIHEAATHEESDKHTTGQIIAVLRQGYKLGERVLRPALVRVAR